MPTQVSLIFWAAITAADIEVCIVMAILYLTLDFQKMIKSDHQIELLKIVGLNKFKSISSHKQWQKVITCFTILDHAIDSDKKPQNWMFFVFWYLTLNFGIKWQDIQGDKWVNLSYPR